MEYYQNPQLTSVNRLPARARRFEALKQSLNGIWKFRLFDAPEDCGDFYSETANTAEYRDIPVPGNWQLYGFGSPIYTNYAYPWKLEGELAVDGEPLAWNIPKENPTGCYRLWFELPAEADGNDVLLRFDGVETAYEVYVNGTFAGYGEDSKLSGEFDITALVRPGKNLLAVRVFTYATSSYLEDQDYWYLCGIFRDADLICVPKARIEDYKVNAVPDRNNDAGYLSADVRVSRTAGYSARTIRGRLYDADGTLIMENTAPIMRGAGYSSVWQPTAATARVVMNLSHVEKWSPEHPYLYKIVFDYCAEDGEVLDSDSCRVGFKRVEIENGILKINGQRVVMFGVNRHEFAWKEGRAVTREHMIAEIESMKRMNINAVRTCHYPDQPLWYDLCDEMGLFVLCECDLETHGVSGLLSHDPAVSGVYLERAQRMVVQHKNHACIYGWSLGNESGCGPGHAAMYGFIKEYDTTRICQYEAGAPGKNISDIRGNMYASEKDILRLLTDPRDDRPVILVEYLYQIRNSGGGMRKFIDLTRRYERFQGGFVWDWQDKALPLPLADGTVGFGHGGDFHEAFVEPKEPPFMTNNGLVRADLQWKPVAYEVREAYAPLLIDRIINDNPWMLLYGEGIFSVVNRTLTQTSGDFDVYADIVNGEGAVLKTEKLTLPVLYPGGKTEIDLKYLTADFQNEPVLFYEFRVYRKDGTECAHRQFRLRSDFVRLPEIASANAPLCEDTGSNYIFRAGGITAVFSKETGLPLSVEKDGKPFLLGASLCHDRPYSGLDAKPGWGIRRQMDEARALPIIFGTPKLLTEEGKTHLAVSFAGGGKLLGTLTWTVCGDGTLECRLNAETASGLILPRLGLELEVPADLRDTEYLGYGPMENYRDRMTAPRFGHYRADIEDLGFAFAPPSENGGHEGTTALTFRSADGRCVGFRSSVPFHFDAHPYTVADCQKAMHTHELPIRDRLVVHLDAYHAPIGGDMAWSTLLDAHDIPGEGTHSISFRVTLA